MQTPLIELFAERGRIKLRLCCIRLGEDLCLTLSGGDQEHIGAVALSQPNSAETSSATTSVLTRPGHRESDLTRNLAAQVAAHTGAVVCVACGIHVDAIQPDELNDVLEIAEELTRNLLERLSVHRD